MMAICLRLNDWDIIHGEEKKGGDRGKRRRRGSRKVEDGGNGSKGSRRVRERLRRG